MADNETREEIIVDGDVIDPEDFTFREQRDMRRMIRELLDDPDAAIDLEALSIADILPAIVVTHKRRTNPEYTLEQALDLRYRDIVRPKDADAPGPPTKPKTSRRA